MEIGEIIPKWVKEQIGQRSSNKDGVSLQARIQRVHRKLLSLHGMAAFIHSMMVAVDYCELDYNPRYLDSESEEDLEKEYIRYLIFQLEGLRNEIRFTKHARNQVKKFGESLTRDFSRLSISAQQNIHSDILGKILHQVKSMSELLKESERLLRDLDATVRRNDGQSARPILRDISNLAPPIKLVAGRLHEITKQVFDLSAAATD